MNTTSNQIITGKKKFTRDDDKGAGIIAGQYDSTRKATMQIVDSNDKEVGFFQYNPTNEQVVFGCNESTTGHSDLQLAFRVYQSSGNAYSVLAPKGTDKTTYIGSGDLTLPLAFSVNSTLYSADSHGIVTLPNYPTVPTNVSSFNNDAGYLTSVSWNDVSSKPTFATVATSGDYDDLINKPTIPAAQVNSDWNAASGVAQILNKPTLASVATSGSYNDLTDKPTIPTVPVTDVTVGGTSVVSSGTAVIPAIPSVPSDIGALAATMCTYQTTAPTAAATDGGVHIVYLSAEPTTKYAGYIYMIAES